MILPQTLSDDLYDSENDEEADETDDISKDELYDVLNDILNDVEGDAEFDDIRRKSVRQIKRSVVKRRTANKARFDQFLGRGRQFVQAWMARKDIFAPTKAASIQATSGVLRHGYDNWKAFLQAWMVLMSPYYTKANTGRITAVAGAATVATLAANCAAVLFAFGDQNLNAERAPFDVTLTFGGKSLIFTLKPNTTPAGAGILLPNDNLGIALIGNFNPIVATVAADKIRPGSWIYLETINAYDIRY